MERLADIQFDRLHHAYLIEGDREEILAALLMHLERIGISIKGNPDVICEEYDVFLLEHAHALRRRQGYRSASGEKKVFIVAFHTIMPEAENALLKTLEEPAAETHFFFVTRTEEALLPTVRSRMQVIKTRTESNNEQNKRQNNMAKKFLESSLSERMKMVDSWLKTKDARKVEAKEEVRVFLDALEFALRGRLSPGNTGTTDALRNILQAKIFLADRAPSMKLILEHLALTLPK